MIQYHLHTTDHSYAYSVHTHQCLLKINRLLKSKKDRLQNTEDYLIYNPQALSSARAKRGRYRSRPSGSKFRRPQCFEV